MQENKFKCFMPHEYKETPYERGSFYKNMFIQDISESIFPVNLLRNEDSINIKLDYQTQDIDSIRSILNGFSLDSYNEVRTDDLLKDAIQGLAKNIAWYGNAIYEIYDENNTIHMINLIPTKFIDFKYFFIQIPPKNKVFKMVNRKYLWKISIPKELQTKYPYKKILSLIDKFHSSMPKPVEENLYTGNNEYFKYDLDQYKEKQFLYVNDLTSEWGWHQRSMGDNIITEFFKNYKYLKLDYSKAVYREHIVKELNNLFKKLNIDAFITIEGIPSSTEYIKRIEKYINNELGYEEIFINDY